jgi:hypothetical protein
VCGGCFHRREKDRQRQERQVRQEKQHSDRQE